jgi:hypothetical protein
MLKITETQKAARVKICRQLLVSHAGDDISCSDEKLCLLQETHNQQNDRIYSVLLRKIPREKFVVEQYQSVNDLNGVI